MKTLSFITGVQLHKEKENTGNLIKRKRIIKKRKYMMEIRQLIFLHCEVT